MHWKAGQRVFAELEPELGLGIVTEVIGTRFVEVVFPGVELARRYSQQGTPLRRLILSSGQKIKTQKGKKIIIKEVHETAGLYLYKSQCGESVWEHELDHVVEDETPVTHFLLGQWSSSRSFSLRKNAWQIRGKSVNPILRGLVAPRVSLLPHQLGIASEIAHRETPRVLLSDEVGLGKTIEAGLIYSSLKQLGRAERVLVIVPEGLENQWLAEMYRRFHEMFSLVDEERSEEELSSQGQSAFQMNQKIICSLPLLEKNAERLQEATEEEWDLLIVDEAHRLRWSEDEPSIEWEIIRLLSQCSRGLCLLTATPQRQGIETQFGLLSLVDPHRFHDFGAFRKNAERMQNIATLAKKVQKEDRSPEFIRELKKAFPKDADLEVEIEKYAKQHNAQPLLESLVDRHGTGRVLMRNRRANIKGFPERKLIGARLDAPQSYLKWLGSLKPQSLDEEEVFHLGAGVPDTLGGATRLEYLDARAQHLLSVLETYKGEKLLLICSQTQIVEELQEWLRTKTSIRTAVFHEEMEIVERDRQAAWFGKPDGAQVLLCSEIGGEGRNFQFCHHLYVFDLPLHPDVLEQRIGRLDRIGQKEEIKIHVPYFAATPEEVLFSWYSEGLEVFGQPWNGAVIGSETRDSLKDTLTAYLPSSKSHSKSETLLKELLKETTKWAKAVRKEQQEGADVLVDINSLCGGRGAQLAKDIRAADSDPSLRLFLDAAFDQFGVEWEKLDEQGTYKITSHSLSYVESLPGLSSSGEVMATMHRSQALAQEELAFLSWEHPIVQGALSVILEGQIGKIAAGIFPRTAQGSRLLVELLYVLQPTAPAFLELDHVIPVQAFSLFVTTDGEFVDVPKGIDDVKADLVRPNLAHDILVPIRERFPALVEKGNAKILETTKPIITSAIKHWNEKFSHELARLEHLSKINPLIGKEEIEANRDKHLEGASILKSTAPRLDAIRLLVFN